MLTLQMLNTEIEKIVVRCCQASYDNVLAFEYVNRRSLTGVIVILM